MTDGPRKQRGGVTEAHRTAWEHTLEEVDAIVEELEADGWTVSKVVADDAVALPRDAGDDDDFGFRYVVPGNHADRLESALEAGDLEQYRVFRQTVDGRVFIVTQLAAPERKTAVLLAGTYDDGTEDRLATTAREEGSVYTHVQRLDGTPVASFRHEDWELFFPDAEDA